MKDTADDSSQGITDCPYCEYVFKEESEIREHLYEVHARDNLSRIDRKRVDQYVEEHGLDESTDEEAQESDRQTGSEQEPVETTGVVSSDAWELGDVQNLSTSEIVDKLADHGIETSAERFQERAMELDSSTALSNQWTDEYEVDATGYDHDFIWMAAEVLWERWASDTPNKERIYDFVQEGRDLRENGDRAKACQRWLTAWEFIVAVTPKEITTIEKADQHLPSFLSLEAFLRSLDSDLASLAADDPAYHEQRLEFCQEVCEQFPDADDDFSLDFRHFVADSLAELGRTADSRTEFEALIEEYPEDPWAYKKLADSYWLNDPDELSIEEMEYTAELYRASLDVEGTLEGASMVADCLDEVESRLADARGSDEEDRDEGL